MSESDELDSMSKAEAEVVSFYAAYEALKESGAFEESGVLVTGRHDPNVAAAFADAEHLARSCAGKWAPELDFEWLVTSAFMAVFLGWTEENIEAAGGGGYCEGAKALLAFADWKVSRISNDKDGKSGT